MASPAASKFALLWAVSGPLFAHGAPQSIVKLDFLDHSVQAEVLIPESELAFATAAEQPSEPFAAYLLRHLSAETPQGRPWKIEVREVRKTTYLEHDYLLAQVDLSPPAGTSAKDFVLVDDAVTHEVRNHVVIVLARGATKPELVGALQYPARRLPVKESTATRN